ncbi:MAG: helix-turn-helix domain-containing protein [Dysgonamonadaceae bacterium]|nr:helix-turn-helix domain-containing protein [Dysgonamonadaceae bacterium]
MHSEAGFINYTTFNRAFKKIEGITPSKYVRQLDLPQNR